MQVLTDEQSALMKQAYSAVRELNDALVGLRKSGIACNIRDEPGYWIMDAKLIITRDHLA